MLHDMSHKQYLTMGRNQKLSSNDLPILSQRRSVQYKKQTDKLDRCPASARDDAALLYSDTRRSKKFDLPSREIRSMKSKGFLLRYTPGYPKEFNSLSATNSMYVHMRSEFMPIMATGMDASESR